jgi:hypothetical protein
MKEKMTTAVSPGEMLQVHSSRGPIGQPIAVPEGVTSITIVFKDTEGFEAAKAARKEKRREGKRNRPAGRKAKPDADDDD